MGYRFIILGVVWSAYLVVTMSRATLGALGPFLVAAFGLTTEQLGWLASALVVTGAPASLLGGALADRQGVRRVLVLGLLLMAPCVGAVSVATSYPMMVATLVLGGFGSSFIWPVAVKGVASWFPGNERATATGIMQTALNVGGIVAATTFPALALSFGWQAGFLVAALLTLVVACATFLLYRDGPPEGMSNTGVQPCVSPLVSDSGAGASGMRKTGSWRNAVLVTASRKVRLLALGLAFINFAEFAMLAHLALYLTKSFAYSAIAAGGLLGLCQVAGLLVKPGSGFVSDRMLGSRRTLALVIVCVVAMLGFALLAMNTRGQAGLLYASVVILGAGVTGWGGLFAALAGELSGVGNAGVTVGASVCVGNIGILLGPPLFGMLADRTCYAAAWLMLAGAAGIAAILFGLVGEPHGSPRLAVCKD